MFVNLLLIVNIKRLSMTAVRVKTRVQVVFARAAVVSTANQKLRFANR